MANDGAAAASGAPGDRRLKARAVPIETFRENVVLLSRHSSALRPERLSGVRKLELVANGQALLASLLICDDPAAVAPDELGLTQPVLRRLGVQPGEMVEVAPAKPPRSLDAMRAKLSGGVLGREQFEAVVHDLSHHRWSDIEISAFLVACASFMTAEETLFLTEAMIGVGTRLTWDRPLVVDKHCIGGIPGNRTSLVIAPIVAAHGLLMPKTSSRAITSPAGSADTMEVLARVNLSEAEMRSVVDSCGACVVWGGRVNLSPADDVLISVERPLQIDTPEQMVASILSKKAAAGSNHLVLDIPVGPTAKIREQRAAIRLKKLFEFVAGHIGMSLEVVLTDGRQPIGRGVGPALEARDVMAVLRGDPEAPADLREKSIILAGRILEADPALTGGSGERRARELLESGAALRKMEAIREAQGTSPIHGVGPGSLVHEVRARRWGRVTGVDCLRIANIARLAGAPTDPGAGVDLLCKEGDTVREGQPLYRIHGQDISDFGFAIDMAGEANGYRIEA